MQHETFAQNLFAMIHDQVLSIQDEEEHGDAATSHGNTSVDMNNNKNNGANGFPADNSQHKQRPASSTSIPIVDPLFPSKVALTVRLAGVKALAYLNYSAAVARGGKTAGGEQVPEQDLLVTLGEMKTSGVEAFFEMDMLHGKVGLSRENLVAGVFGGGGVQGWGITYYVGAFSCWVLMAGSWQTYRNGTRHSAALQGLIC